jgi:hypothetical protein
VKRKSLNKKWFLIAMLSGGFPKWEEYPHTPGVFVRVANKGVAGYGTWKSIRKMEGKVEQWAGWKHPPPPTFFVKDCSAWV